ncbi:fumarylacetoacetate hydrolase family protein [Persicimonas caeni]|uniref:Fumarylacetoacetate hydrolase family protein n=1 Tax=Persicimonas caeni TaxID=2292766 RepID=A0A4Y6Q186_PERCE|nr:fumarylacetoacetate hydrolase family protein [Persicimonas caeni]QDG53997.1 fumarylacetoacetate hydrolase family protein [Persicimonas caeni]QED35218.1 fumarylacetoacetate hydrolase family protein [Persicimonas caeni]
MKLGTLKDGTRDGRLVVVKRDNSVYATADGIAKSMQEALDNWDEAEPKLQELFEKLEAGEVDGEPVDVNDFHSPLPRAYEWIDGSAYINHIVLVRKARDAEPPETLETDPLVYQGGSGHFLAPTEDIPLPNPEWGLDFEAEIAVVMGDTPRGVSKEEAGEHVKLLMLVNDNTFRNLIPGELAKSFGFFQSKPATTFSPFAVTPDELGDKWDGGRVNLPLETDYNGEFFGDPEAGPEMHFSFFDLIQHVTKTRSFTAGTILGSGTVSNEDQSKGSSCLSEKRMLEKIETGEFKTPYMQVGDTVKIEMKDEEGNNIFGTIQQKVVDAS